MSQQITLSRGYSHPAIALSNDPRACLTPVSASVQNSTSHNFNAIAPTGDQMQAMIQMNNTNNELARVQQEINKVQLALREQQLQDELRNGVQPLTLEEPRCDVRAQERTDRSSQRAFDRQIDRGSETVQEWTIRTRHSLAMHNGTDSPLGRLKTALDKIPYSQDQIDSALGRLKTPLDRISYSQQRPQTDNYLIEEVQDSDSDDESDRALNRRGIEPYQSYRSNEQLALEQPRLPSLPSMPSLPEMSSSSMSWQFSFQSNTGHEQYAYDTRGEARTAVVRETREARMQQRDIRIVAPSTTTTTPRTTPLPSIQPGTTDKRLVRK